MKQVKQKSFAGASSRAKFKSKSKSESSKASPKTADGLHLPAAQSISFEIRTKKTAEKRKEERTEKLEKRTEKTAEERAEEKAKAHYWLAFFALAYGAVGLYSALAAIPELKPAGTGFNFVAVMISASVCFSVLFFVLAYSLYSKKSWAARFGIYLTLADIITGSLFAIISEKLGYPSSSEVNFVLIIIIAAEFGYIYLLTKLAKAGQASGHELRQENRIKINKE